MAYLKQLSLSEKGTLWLPLLYSSVTVFSRSLKSRDLLDSPRTETSFSASDFEMVLLLNLRPSYRYDRVGSNNI